MSRQPLDSLVCGAEPRRANVNTCHPVAAQYGCPMAGLSSSEDGVPQDAALAAAPPVRIQVARDPDSFVPTLAFPHDAGHDLAAARDYTIAPQTNVLVRTGLRIAIPSGYAGLLLP